MAILVRKRGYSDALDFKHMRPLFTRTNLFEICRDIFLGILPGYMYLSA